MAPDVGEAALGARLTPPQLRAAALAAQRAHAHDRAFAAWRAYLAIRPGDAGAWSNLWALLRARRDFDTAAICQRRADELRPNDAAILNNLGNALHDANALDDALAARLKVRALAPDRPDPAAMLAATLRALGRAREAIAVVSAALERWPEHAELRLQRALALLEEGDYPAGFADFDARWDIGEITRPTPPAPWWQGEDIAGKCLLVLPEQGFGDILLMARLLAPLKARTGAQVLLAARPPLMRLLRGLDGVDGLLAADAPIPKVDAAVMMMELPARLGLTADAVPPAPALHIPADAASRAARIAAPFADRLKVGVMWAGSTTYRGDRKRSVEAERFAPLAAIPGVQLFSLYKGPLGARFRASPASAIILDASGDERDFADCAAMIRQLDLVISIDSAVAHLAASLGADTWVALDHAPYWIYARGPGVGSNANGGVGAGVGGGAGGGAGGGVNGGVGGGAHAATPWHPSMRAFRQTAPGDWDGVFARIEAALRERAAAR
jgi:hypothetical protein